MLFARDLLGLMEMYRAVYIAGRYGSGKTALAVALGRALQRQGYKFVSNIPVDGALMYWPDDEPIDHSVVLLDEAADFLDAYDFKEGRRLLAAFKYLRHWDIIVLMPCVDVVQKRIRKLVVRRVYDASWVSLGLATIWLYRYDIADARKSLGGYCWFLPSPRDFAYTSTHRGRGTTTINIVARLLQEARQSDIIAARGLGLESSRRPLSIQY